jgi:hypothetical protein
MKIIAKSAKPTATKPTTTPKPSTTKAEIPAKAVAKMTAWNEAHPELKFSWLVIGPDTPVAQQSCTTCHKKFRAGRITRVANGAAFCGPKCQHPKKAAKKATAKA